MQREKSFTAYKYKNNIQHLTIETFEGKHGLSSEVFESMFVINNNSSQLHAKSYFSVAKMLNISEKIKEDH